jgi:hypothetical protein
MTELSFTEWFVFTLKHYGMKTYGEVEVQFDTMSPSAIKFRIQAVFSDTKWRGDINKIIYVLRTNVNLFYLFILLSLFILFILLIIFIYFIYLTQVSTAATIHLGTVKLFWIINRKLCGRKQPNPLWGTTEAFAFKNCDNSQTFGHNILSSSRYLNPGSLKFKIKAQVFLMSLKPSPSR